MSYLFSEDPDDFLPLSSQHELHRTERPIEQEQQEPLCPVELSFYQGRQGHQQHDREHHRDIQHQGGVMPEEHRVLRDPEGCQGDGDATDQHQVEQVGADHIAQGKGSVALR